MTANMQAARISAATETILPAYLADLQYLCSIDTRSGHAPGIDETAAWIGQWGETRGWDVREWPDTQAGAGIAVSIAGGNPTGLRVMLVVHHDTVFPVGTAAARPLRTEGDRIYGPGVIDIKSGILSSLYAMATLEDLDLLGDFARISFVSTPDEEVDMRVSKVMLEDLAPSYDVALSVEAAAGDGKICSARKGGATYTLTVSGQSAHASKPEEGANAIQAIAQQVQAIQALHAFRPEVTVNVGTIAGGTADNVVPDHARSVIDVRMTGHPGDVEAIEAAFTQIGSTTHVPGTTSNMSRDLYFPPMPATPEIIELAELAVASASELGFRLEYSPQGGITLANLLAGYGLPTLDGLGPVGGGEHSAGEFIDVTSIVPRTNLLAHFLGRLAAEHRTGR